MTKKFLFSVRYETPKGFNTTMHTMFAATVGAAEAALRERYEIQKIDNATFKFEGEQH